MTLTYDDFKNYYDGVVEINAVMQKLKNYGYKNLVIPSRGVCPIKLIADKLQFSTIRKISSEENSPKFYIEEVFGDNFGEIWLPFTAQTGVNTEDDNSKEIRLNWCIVLKSILEGKESINYKVYNILSDLIGRTYGHTKCRVYKNAPFIFLDTAISGRATVEIIESLLQLGLTNFKMIIAVDDNGEKLKSNYKTKLVGEYQKYVELVYFKNLFTEDLGPASTIVTGVIYPNLTKSLKSIYKEEIIATGTMHMFYGNDYLCSSDLLEFEKNNHFQKDRQFFQCEKCFNIGAVINRIHASFFLIFHCFENQQDDRNLIDKCINDYNNLYSGYEFLHKNTTLDFFEKTGQNSKISHYEISSSHVVRAHLCDDFISLIEESVESYESKYKNTYLAYK